MKLEHRQSNFHQFSDELWLKAEHDGTRIDFDVSQYELLDFARELIGLSIDCIRKSEVETSEDIDDRLCAVLDELN